MVDIRPSDDYPNVLTVSGPEITHDDYRTDLRGQLLDNAQSPVRSGTRHFWITYFVPTTRGGEFDDGDLTVTPGKFRGVIRMGRLPGGTSTDQVAGHMRIMLEEVGHHWLVCNDMQFAGDAATSRLAGAMAWTEFVNGTTSRLDGLPLLGRTDVH